jgi:hypothetical protein
MAGEEIRDRAVELLVANDPRRAGERTIDLLFSITDALSCGLFSVVTGRPVLFLSRHVDETALERVHEAWKTFRGSLATGQPFVPLVSFGVFPLAHRGELVGLLYLAGPRRFADQVKSAVDAVSPLLAIATKHAGVDAGSPIENYLERTPFDEIEREKLLLLLERNEWNLSRVARLLGVTRVTVYNRMEKFQIRRVRVSKSIAGRRLPST